MQASRTLSSTLGWRKMVLHMYGELVSNWGRRLQTKWVGRDMNDTFLKREKQQNQPITICPDIVFAACRCIRYQVSGIRIYIYIHIYIYIYVYIYIYSKHNMIRVVSFFLYSNNHFSFQGETQEMDPHPATLDSTLQYTCKARESKTYYTQTRTWYTQSVFTLDE